MVILKLEKPLYNSNFVKHLTALVKNTLFNGIHLPYITPIASLLNIVSFCQYVQYMEGTGNPL